jgi:rRNA maturation RNase YbeY
MSYIFHKEDTSFRFLDKTLIIKWLSLCMSKEKKKEGELSFIFCSDKYLLNINRQYLQHDDYTDIITFDYTQKNLVSGDIYISIERVKENAQTYKVTFQNELLRVMVHGVLHLCGYKDKTSRDARIMREKEDYYLSLWPKQR